MIQNWFLKKVNPKSTPRNISFRLCSSELGILFDIWPNHCFCHALFAMHYDKCNGYAKLEKAHTHRTIFRWNSLVNETWPAQVPHAHGCVGLGAWTTNGLAVGWSAKNWSRSNGQTSTSHSEQCEKKSLDREIRVTVLFVREHDRWIDHYPYFKR